MKTIGIGMTTRNRPDVLENTLKNLYMHIPTRMGIHFDYNFVVVIVDDASGEPYRHATYRFNENVGVARSKNKCLELLDHCDHIFLFDDDTYPLVWEWWKPYVESKEPHLMYQFKLPNKPANDMMELYRDDSIVAYNKTRGGMLYIDRKVLDVVGGFDTRYGTSMFEHADWTNRIHNAGLTTHRAMDVPGSEKIFYCLDQDGKAESSIPPSQRKRNILRNSRIYRQSISSSEYREYRS
jgi:glycosyltransferase involved in cell wall biosynthesis